MSYPLPPGLPGVSSTRARRLAGILAACGAAVAMTGAAALADPQTAVTSPVDPTLTTDTYALLSGTINPNGQQTYYDFQWGTTPAYGNTTPVTPAGNGKADVPVDFALDSLAPATTYHYRLVVLPLGSDPNNPPPDIYGQDATFTTAAALGVQKAGSIAHVVGTVASVPVKVVGPTDETATGTLVLRGRYGNKTVPLGSGSYSLDSGSTKSVKVHLNSAGVAARKAAKHHRLTVTASAKTKGIKTPATWRLTVGS